MELTPTVSLPLNGSVRFFRFAWHCVCVYIWNITVSCGWNIMADHCNVDVMQRLPSDGSLVHVVSLFPSLLKVRVCDLLAVSIDLQHDLCYTDRITVYV